MFHISPFKLQHSKYQERSICFRMCVCEERQESNGEPRGRQAAKVWESLLYNSYTLIQQMMQTDHISHSIPAHIDNCVQHLPYPTFPSTPSLINLIIFSLCVIFHLYAIPLHRHTGIFYTAGLRPVVSSTHLNIVLLQSHP